MQNKKSHSILVLCDAFGKPAYTPRLRYLCDYLVAKGWHVDVFTEQFEPLPFSHSYRITEIPIYRYRKLDWFFKAIGIVLFDWKSRFYARRVIRQVANIRYDAVLACTFPATPLRAAYAVAQAQQIPMLIDLRDLDEQTPTHQYQAHRRWNSKFILRLYRALNIHRRNYYISRANSLSSVSPWHVCKLHQWNEQVHLIYNGFDEHIFVPRNVRSDAFRIIYTGRIYDKALQDPSLFFKALQEMRAAGQLPEEMTIDWYSDATGQARIQHWAKQTGTENYMHFYAYVSTEQIPDLLHQCSIALVISHKTNKNGPHGIMTTKFFEALGVEKPVLCVPSDEECLATVIKETNAGIAATSVEEIKAFILDKYAEWKENGFTHQPVYLEQKKFFSRQYQAQQFEQILLNTINGQK